ncbi:hypothetical protein B0J13DRAFT_557075, partial [Dactylonectria estremocensis]
RWKTSGGLDFASSVERVMAIIDGESTAGREVTLEELDDTLDQIAASSSFSSASLRERVTTKHGRSICADDLLSKIFRALQSSETKWMIRIISKNYSPACVLETLPAVDTCDKLKEVATGSRWMSVERKYNGEYSAIKIFSKSGRDSTNDCMGIHRALWNSLELDIAGCKVKKRCILEGELLVWNDDDGRIEPFYKIRRYLEIRPLNRASIS